MAQGNALDTRNLYQFINGGGEGRPGKEFPGPFFYFFEFLLGAALGRAV
jgi:hypothetical protein